MTLPADIGARVGPIRAHGSDALRQDLRSLVPGGMLVGLWVAWISLSGGYDAETWYPSALGIMSLLVAVLSCRRRLLPTNPWARAGLLLFAALVALNYLSILWAGSQGSALAASNELALYLLVAWTFAVLPWTARALATALGLWSIGVCCSCAVVLLHATSASSLTAFFINARFASPMGYSNATAALAVMGMWPALLLSARRELPPWLRGILLGAAVFLADFCTLPQTRAALLGLALTAPLALLVSSQRGRLVLRMAVAGGALALCLPTTVDVDTAVNAGARVSPVLAHSASVMLWSSVAAVLVGIALAVLERRVSARWVSSRGGAGGFAFRRRLSPRVLRRVVVCSALVAIVIAGVVAEPKLVHLANTVVHKGNVDASTGSVRLLSASPEERLDYIRVAAHLFSTSPLVGIGSGNFGRRYDALRRFVKHSQYTHNLPLRVLSETGLVGALLFVALLAALVVGMTIAARRQTGLHRTCTAIAFCVAGYFLVHSCFDWVDEFPSLAAPALALPLAVMSLAPAVGLAANRADRSAAGAAVLDGSRWPTRPRWTRWRPSPLARRATAGVAAMLAGGGLLYALSTSYISLRLVDRAFATFRAAPSQAHHDLSLAASLEPLSSYPLTSEGTISLYLGDEQRARNAFVRSIRMEDNWYPRLELALLDAHTGRFASALAQIDAAIRLDVDDPVIDQGRQLIRAHRRIDPLAFNQQVLQEGAKGAVQQTIR